MKKFLNVEMIICLVGGTWYNDYVLIPYPEAGEMIDETKFKAKQKWQQDETEKNNKLPKGEIIPIVTYIGVYSYNMDEPVDENGDFIDE